MQAGSAQGVSRIMIEIGGRKRPLTFDAGADSGPLLNSATTAWAGIPLEVHRTQPTEELWSGGPAKGEQHLLIVLDGAFEVVARGAHGDVRHRAVAGSMSFHSGSGATVLRVVGSARAVALGFSPAWLARLTHDGAPPRLGTSYRNPEPDATARSLATAMCEEVARGAPTGRLFAESLSLALLSYAIERAPLSRMQVRGALSEGQCRKLRRHVGERLGEELRLAELAALCDLGERQFSILFRRAFGKPVHRYVLEQRLAQGARWLVSGSYDIAEIALRTGFSSQSHFTTMFRRTYGVTPRRYARSVRE